MGASYLCLCGSPTSVFFRQWLNAMSTPFRVLSLLVIFGIHASLTFQIVRKAVSVDWMSGIQGGELQFPPALRLLHSASQTRGDHGAASSDCGRSGGEKVTHQLEGALGVPDNDDEGIVSPSSKSSQQLFGDLPGIDLCANLSEVEQEPFHDFSDLEVGNPEELYSSIIEDMGGTTSPSPALASTRSTDELSVGDEVVLASSMKTFLEQALDTAMREVKTSLSAVDANSVLSEGEAEIKAIVEKGRERWIREIEKDQKELNVMTKKLALSVNKTTQPRVNSAERLDKVEMYMSTMLQRFREEKAAVELAKADIERAHAELVESEGVFSSSFKGLSRQACFVGTFLFASRSVVDTVAALSSEETLMAPAVLEAGVAVFFALVFFSLNRFG